jgi:hypothetical protein
MRQLSLIVKLLTALFSIGIAGSCTKSTPGTAAIVPGPDTVIIIRPDTIVVTPPDPKHIRYEIHGSGLARTDVQYTPDPHSVSVSLPWFHDVTLADTAHTVQIVLSDFHSLFPEDIDVKIFLNNEKIKDTTLRARVIDNLTTTITCNF